MREDDDKPKEDEIKEGDAPSEDAVDELLEETEEDDPLMAPDEDEKPWE